MFKRRSGVSVVSCLNRRGEQEGCDQQKALFQLKLKDYPLGTVFQIGVRVHLQDKTPVEILYPKEIIVK